MKCTQVISLPPHLHGLNCEKNQGTKLKMPARNFKAVKIVLPFFFSITAMHSYHSAISFGMRKKLSYKSAEKFNITFQVKLFHLEVLLRFYFPVPHRSRSPLCFYPTTQSKPNMCLLNLNVNERISVRCN